MSAASRRTRGQHERIRQDRLWRARRPQGRNLRRLRRRRSQAVAGGRGADRRGGARLESGGQSGRASAARPRPRSISRRAAGLDGRAAPGHRRRAGQGRQADRFRHSRRLRLRQDRRGEEGRASRSRRRRATWDAVAAADFALGLRLRAYRFDKYKTKKETATSADDAAGGDDRRRGSSPPRARAADAREAVAEGVELARDLVNEPPNILFPEDFAERAAALRSARGRRSRCSTKRRWPSSAWARCSASARARRATAASSSCAGTGPGRRRKQNQADRLRRQGRLFRHRRHFDQAGRRHGGYEGRHGGRGLRRRPDARAGQPQGEGQRDRRDRPGREHAERRGASVPATS